MRSVKSFSVLKPYERRRFVASGHALHVPWLWAVATDALSLCSQIAQELNQVLGNLNTAAPSQQNGEALLTNGDSTQAKQVCTYDDPRIYSPLSTTTYTGW
jgi:hypothetical protein